MSSEPPHRNRLEIIRPTIIQSGPGMPVVIYARKSNEDKVASNERQLAEAREHCHRHGWIVIGEYIDEDRSGSKRDVVREQFDAVVERAEQVGDYKAVVVLMTSRFTRADSIGGASVKDRLRIAGVHLETVRGIGRVDWNTKSGRMADFISCEADNDLSLNISAQSVSGRSRCITSGYWPYGSIPYGYNAQFHDETGQPRQIVFRRDKRNKPVSWRVKLTINPEEAETVQWIFEQISTLDISWERLAIALNGRGVKSPAGDNSWKAGAISDIACNKAYAGIVESGYRPAKKTQTFNRLEKKSNPTGCPAIIDPETFELVQQKLDRNKMRGKKGAREGISPLAGVAVCGHCGHTLVYSTSTTRGKKYSYYKCESASKRPALGCRQWRASAEELTYRVTQALGQAIDGIILSKYQAEPPKPDNINIDRLTKQAADLDKNIAKGAKNLLLADSEVFSAMQAQLAELRAEHRKIINTIQLAHVPEKSELQRIQKWWDANRETLEFVVGMPMTVADIAAWNRGTGPRGFAVNGKLHHAAAVLPDTLRDLLHRLNCRVVCHWTPRGNRYYHLDYAHLKADFDPAAVCAVNGHTCKRIRRPARNGVAAERSTRW